MSYCRDCGTEVQPGTRFCTECGTKLDPSPETPSNEPPPTQAAPSNEPPPTQAAPSEGSQYTHPGEDGFAVKHAVIVGLLALIPAIILGVISPGGFGIVGFLVGIPLFTYLGYQKPTIKSAFSRHAFWNAVMLLLSPLMMIVHTWLFIGSETEGGAEALGGAIGGAILVILAFVVGLPLAGVFYLVHKKTELPDEQSTGA